MTTRRLFLALCAIGFWLATPVSATATVSLSVDGDRLSVTGDNASQSLEIVPATSASGGVIGSDIFGLIALPLPSPCAVISVSGSQRVRCYQDGSRPGSQPLYKLALRLGAGADRVTVRECYTEGDIGLGAGADELELPESCDGTFAVRGDAGADTVTTRNSSLRITADLGPDDDRFLGHIRSSGVSTGGSAQVDGGPGADEIFGTSGNDTLGGGDGSDTLLGLEGDDALDGGPGDDTLDSSSDYPEPPGDPGADDVRGGEGIDDWFSGDDGGITVTLNDQADDRGGETGAGDNIHSDVERVYGGAGRDTITAGPAPARIHGYGGDDVLVGGPASDALHGDGGADRLSGGVGRDMLEGGVEDDIVDGGPDPDSLYGDTETCTLQSCPAGNDLIRARDGAADAVQCGPGADRAEVDHLDVVALDGLAVCEAVDRSPAPGPTCCAPPPPSPGPVLGVSLRGTGSLRAGLSATVTCPAACRYTVSVVVGPRIARRYRLGRRKITIAIAEGKLAAAGSRTVRLKLTKRAKKRLRRMRPSPATLKVRVKTADGKVATRSSPIRLRR